MKRLRFVWAMVLVLTPLTVLSAPGTLARALQYIASIQQDSGGWTVSEGQTHAGSEPTSLAVKVLAMNGTDKPRVDKGVAFLLKEQKPDGSWNANTTDTAFAVLALSQARQGGASVEKAGDYLRAVQDRDGGFRKAGNEGTPMTVDTAVVLDALKAAAYRKRDAMVEQALMWLVSCQNPDGGYGASRGLPSAVVSTAWSIIALGAYDFVPSMREIGKAIDWLVKAQRPSGGFPAVLTRAEDPEATAYAVMALARIPDQGAAVRKALEYLAPLQQGDGSFKGGAAGKDILLTCFTAWAVSEIK